MLRAYSIVHHFTAYPKNALRQVVGKKRMLKVGPPELQWVACMGDFVLLKTLISRKNDSFLWFLLGWCDSLFRGFGQVVFANNPISGIIIMIAFALTAPGSLVAGAGTGFLGLLLSLVSIFYGAGRRNRGEAACCTALRIFPAA